ncbi:MAG: TIR domain-containing protein [Dehalococcoidia bacterium]
MLVEHLVRTYGDLNDPRLAALDEALAIELRSMGLHMHVTVQFTADEARDCTVGVYAASNPTDNDPDVKSAITAGHLVFPIFDSLSGRYEDQVPEELLPINGIDWSRGPAHAARAVLEEIGVSDHHRRVFVSHRRSDGALAAEQAHDALSHLRFDPFIDRYSIRPSDDHQARIAEALEEFTFLLLLETPDASESTYVFYEVDYAMSRAMGIYIITWPGADPTPGTTSLRRRTLLPEHLEWNGSNSVIKSSILEEITHEIEREHASALARRRRALVANVQDVLHESGRAFLTLPRWRVAASDGTFIGVAPRLPAPEDLHALAKDAAETGIEVKRQVLVHAARRFREARREMLEWTIGGRPLEMLAENTIGATL